MNVGMLWYDNDPQTALKAKVEKAAAYYRQKYGLTANLCLVNPAMLAGPRPDPVEAGAWKVTVRPSQAIQPGHLWIGTEDKN
jgi:hypothetical protein